MPSRRPLPPTKTPRATAMRSVIALFVTYAAWALLHPRELATRLRGRRLVGPALALAFFALVCVPHFAPDAGSLWSRGTYADAGG